MNCKKIKNDLLKRSYADDRGIICHSHANITLVNIPSINEETIIQRHLPSFMILSICGDKLHISKANAKGDFKKYFGALFINKLTFINSYNIEFNYVYEFKYELEHGPAISFYISSVYEKPEVIEVVEAINNFKKDIPLNNNYGFTIDPQEWYEMKFDYLNELANNLQLYQLSFHIVDYYLLRVFFDEVSKGGLLNFFNNSYKKSYDKYLCLDIIKDMNITTLLYEAIEIFENYDLEDINFSNEDLLIVEELNNKFSQYKDHFFDEINFYYTQSYKELANSGFLMIEEMNEDNAYSKICEHLKPILKYELCNNNSLHEVRSNDIKGKLTVDLVNNLTFFENEILSMWVDYIDKSDYYYKYQLNGYCCNNCNHKMVGPGEKSLLKYLSIMTFAFVLSMLLGLILGGLILSLLALMIEEFSIILFITCTTIGVLFGLRLFILNFLKIKIVNDMKAKIPIYRTIILKFKALIYRL